MKFDSVVFDLDGTLWDTTPLCAVAWNNVIARNGIPFREITAEDVQKVTGMPHDDCIRLTFEGAPADQVQTLIDETAVEDNLMIARGGATLYEGVAEGLVELSKHYPLYIVSNCQTGYVEMFYGLTGLGGLFRDFECFGHTGMPKAHNLRKLIERNGLKNPIMVGDTSGDEAAARANQIPFAYMHYGFGEADAADHSFHSFADLVKSLVG